MIKTIKITTLLFLILAAQISFGQSDKEKALARGMEAVKLMDNGKVDESIKLLEEAQKLDPDKFDYAYELAYAHYMKEDFKGAIKILEKNKDHKDVSERYYQLLGNNYDIVGKTDDAFATYDAGLKKFPNSGMIYLEKGNVYAGKKEYNKALLFYEKGIEVDPKFSSNYYWAAMFYCSSTEEVWGMLYGEIFMNLERNTKRTSEISKLLFDTYKSQIKFTTDSTMTVSFCQNMTMSVDKLSNSKSITQPFCLVYEPTLLIPVAFEKSIDINSLDRIRKGFIENYFIKNFDKTHPNILFDYQHELLVSGNFEAYNHWILMKGDEDNFVKWQSANKGKWENFVKWFSSNKIQINREHRFYKGQY